MAENADGYIDFAIDDVEKRPGRTLKEIGNLRTSKNGGRSDKENQNVGNDGRGKPNLPSRQDRLLYSIASLTPLLKKFTIKGTKLPFCNTKLSFYFTYWLCISFSASNSKRWNDNTETCRWICKAFQFHCHG